MNLNDYDVSEPYYAIIKSTTLLTPEAHSVEVRHIVLDIPDPTFNFTEGQSIGVLIPGPHKFGNPHHLRLYTVASASNGEGGNPSEISICVRRCTYIDDVSGEEVEGVASNFLCDASVGDKLEITGPYGRHFTMPKDKNSNLLMIGTGTGIAPFRAFVKYMYEESGGWEGKVRLFYGAQTGMEMLYMNDESDDISQYLDKETFTAIQAMSPRPHFDDPIDLQGTLKDHEKEIWDLVNDPNTYVYVAGQESTKEHLDNAMAKMAGSEDAWNEKLKTLEEEERWAELIY